jgi:Ni,Fe-hydrogenase III small subunit
LIGAEAEGSTIPEAVPVEGVVPEIQEAAGATPEPAEVASGGAPAMPKRNATRYCQSQTWK